MSEIEPLIADLALILICAGVMTLVFKKLKQPLVLGYIVAGFIASPHFALTPSVIDTASIHTWSDIGVIFLLFAEGGRAGRHRGPDHHFRHDLPRVHRRLQFRLEQDGRPVPGRYDLHVVHNDHL